MNDLQRDLFLLADEGYRAFHGALVPTLPRERLIGVRAPDLRRYAAAFAKTPGALPFLDELPHEYYEENNLHGMLLDRVVKEHGELLLRLDAFLPFVDNWATCDSLSFRLLRANREETLPHIERWLASPHVYTTRFAIVTLMKNYLDDCFPAHMPRRLAAMRTDEYYVNMALAWYFAEALAKKPEAALPVLEEGLLDAWVHNKAIQKAGESRRVSPEWKARVKALRIH